jgi:hypothetical protein
MEPVSTAIVAALAAGALQGVGEAAANAVADGYQALKSALQRRFGSESSVVKAVEELEARPESKGRQEVVREEVEVSGANTDPDLVQAAKRLLESISEVPGGETHIQQAVGSYIAQADRAGRAEVRVNTTQEPSGDG